MRTHEYTTPFKNDAAFSKKVQKYLSEYLGDWADDFNLPEDINTIWQKIYQNVEARGSLIEVYRKELRPADQIEDLSFGSLGGSWSWSEGGAQVCHHDNAREDHGEDTEELMFIGWVEVSSVDWVQTIAKNLVLQREREIAIRDGATVLIDYVIDHEGNFAGEDISLRLPIHNPNEF